MTLIEADRKKVVSRISLACDKHPMPPARRIQTLAQTMNSVSGNDWAWMEVEESMTKVVNALDLLRDPEGAGMRNFAHLEPFPGASVNTQDAAK